MKNKRLGVGIMLINSDKKVFVGKRVDTPFFQGNTMGWQMPQGGIDLGETPQQAAMRELKEEVGTDKAEILAETKDWLEYDLPEELQKKLWSGHYDSVKQKWFLMHFLGTDSDININETNHPEFSAWRWAEPETLVDLIIDFKKDTYEKVLREFVPFLY